VNTWMGRAAAVALLSFGAARADAQITTVIAPPKRVEAQTAAAVRREEVAQDSIARVTLTGMKQWVDSAAESLALRPDTGTVPSESPTTATAPAPPQRPDTSAAAARRESEPALRGGARAPDTATQVPALALAGAALIILGVALRRRPRLARARSGR
jgi:hypothetical protein